MKPIILDDIKRRIYPIKPGVLPLKHPIVVYGFDTETDENGNITVLACSDKTYSLGNIIGDVLEFLTKDKYYHSINFFYNLGFDHNAVFKTIFTPYELRKLSLLGSVKKGKYIINYIDGKLLKIVKHGMVFRYFDISQFYDKVKLITAYKNTFGHEYTKRLDAKDGFSSIDNDVVQYCIEDSIACQELSLNLVKVCNALVPINKFYSFASLAKKVMQQNLKTAYFYHPNKINQFAMFAYSGARIETLKRGTWGLGYNNEALYMYDIRSAYPSVQCELNQIKGNDIRNIPEYMPDSLHSFFKISIEIEDCIIGCLKYRFGGTMFYPKGKMTEIYIDKNEIELLMDYDIKFKIIGGIHDIGISDYKPYGYLKDLYEYRMKYKKEKNPIQLALKGALNSSYGVLIERNNKRYKTRDYTEDDLNEYNNQTLIEDDNTISLVKSDYHAGVFFNPIHAAEVTSAIRCKIYRDSIGQAKHVVKYATDSITFDKKVNLDFGEKLGQYEDSPKFEGLVIGSGVYSLRSGEKTVNKFRSFDRLNLIELALENKDKCLVEVVKKAPIKLKESKRDNYKYFNNFDDKHKRLDINFDLRREWHPAKLKDFNDLLHNIYDSRPLNVCEIKNFV